MSRTAASSEPVLDTDLVTNKQVSDWLWTVSMYMLITLLLLVARDLLRPKGTRLFYQIAGITLTTGSLAYYSMARAFESAPLKSELRIGRDILQIRYARYGQWMIGLPLLLLSALLATGSSLPDIVMTLFMALLLVTCGLVNNLVLDTSKWSIAIVGTVSLCYIWYSLLWRGTHTISLAGDDLRRVYRFASVYLSFVLLAYAACWTLAEGSGVISPTSATLAYSILDSLAGPVFLQVYLTQLDKVNRAPLDSYDDTDEMSDSSSSLSPPLSLRPSSSSSSLGRGLPAGWVGAVRLGDARPPQSHAYLS